MISASNNVIFSEAIFVFWVVNCPIPYHRNKCPICLFYSTLPTYLTTQILSCFAFNLPDLTFFGLNDQPTNKTCWRPDTWIEMCNWLRSPHNFDQTGPTHQLDLLDLIPGHTNQLPDGADEGQEVVVVNEGLAKSLPKELLQLWIFQSITFW